MFSCFTKCCAKKNSITNHPVKKVSDSILRELEYYRDPKIYETYGALPRVLNNLKELEAFKNIINNDSTQNVSSV